MPPPPLLKRRAVKQYRIRLVINRTQRPGMSAFPATGRMPTDAVLLLFCKIVAVSESSHGQEHEIWNSYDDLYTQ